MKFSLTGTNQMRARLLALASRMPAEVGAALYAEAEILMGEAKDRTPVDTGALKASGLVTLPEIHGREIAVDLAFGGASAPYAVYVHEDLRAHHTVGQAKFLESVLLERGPDLAERIADRVGQRTGMR